MSDYIVIRPDGERIEIPRDIEAMGHSAVAAYVEDPTAVPPLMVPNPLAGVDFGSDVAMELAADSGLVAADFEGREGSGDGGAFVKRDIEALLAEQSAAMKEEE